MKSLRERYIQQFTSMEQAVTSLQSTGEYLTNLLDAMNNEIKLFRSLIYIF